MPIFNSLFVATEANLSIREQIERERENLKRQKKKYSE
jgi:hypothetical protein